MSRRLVLVAASFAILSALSLAGCDDSTTTIVEPEPTGTVTFNFDNYIGAEPVLMDTLLYYNPRNTKYSISMLRYTSVLEITLILEIFGGAGCFAAWSW